LWLSISFEPLRVPLNTSQLHVSLQTSYEHCCQYAPTCLGNMFMRVNFIEHKEFYIVEYNIRQPLWSNGQSSWLQIQRSGVPFPALPDFLRSSGSGTGPLSLVSITEELLEPKSSGSGSRKPRLRAVGIRCADHATLFIRKSWH
jgi:hypothetical protein